MVSAECRFHCTRTEKVNGIPSIYLNTFFFAGVPPTLRCEVQYANHCTTVPSQLKILTPLMFLSIQGGPCGVLAAVQAFVLKHLLFGGKKVDTKK